MALRAQLILYFVGYVAAVISASFVTTALYTFLLKTSYFDLQFQIAYPISKFWEMLMVGCFYTSAFAFPGFVISVILSKYFSWTSGWKFILSGTTTAALAHFIIYAWLQDGILLVAICSLFGGAAGGYVYWLNVGKLLSSKPNN